MGNIAECLLWKAKAKNLFTKPKSKTKAQERFEKHVMYFDAYKR